MDALHIGLFTAIIILASVIVWYNTKIIALVKENEKLKEHIFVLEDNMYFIKAEFDTPLGNDLFEETADLVIQKMELKEFLYFDILEYLPDGKVRVRYELLVWKRKKNVKG